MSDWNYYRKRWVNIDESWVLREKAENPCAGKMSELPQGGESMNKDRPKGKADIRFELPLHSLEDKLKNTAEEVFILLLDA